MMAISALKRSMFFICALEMDLTALTTPVDLFAHFAVGTLTELLLVDVIELCDFTCVVNDEVGSLHCPCFGRVLHNRLGSFALLRLSTTFGCRACSRACRVTVIAAFMLSLFRVAAAHNC